MSNIDLKLRIRIVVLMARFECPTQVSRVLKGEGFKDIPSKVSIKRNYEKFCEFGTILDLPKSGRPKISDDESTIPIIDILEDNPKSSSKQISAAIGAKAPFCVELNLILVCIDLRFKSIKNYMKMTLIDELKWLKLYCQFFETHHIKD